MALDQRRAVVYVACVVVLAHVGEVEGGLGGLGDEPGVVDRRLDQAGGGTGF